MSEFSESGYLASLDNLLPDNSTQKISPKDIRDSFINLVDSSHNFLKNHSIEAKNIASLDLRQTRVGLESLSKTYLVYESGIDNSAFGYAALNANVTGKENTGLGSYALSCNLDGSYNVGVGFSSVAGNVEGNGNVGVGNRSLYGLSRGDFNIALGFGAGYYIGQNDNYQLYIGAHPEASGADCLDGSGTPLLRGDLEQLKLAIGTNEIHNYGTLQVSGDVSPTVSRSHSLGNSNRAWSSINGTLNFPDSNTITSAANITPTVEGLNLGSEDARWDGFFNDLNVSGLVVVNDLEYTTITSNLYEAKTLHLATDGLCDADSFGVGPGAVCGYLSDQGIDGAGFEVHSSGADYRRDYKFVYRFPNVELTCLEDDTVFSRSHWESNISLSTLPGRHVLTDRVLGRETLSLRNSDCQGILISGQTITIGAVPPKTCYDGINIYENDLNLIEGESGVINQRFLSQGDNCSTIHGFSFRYTDTPSGSYPTSGNFFALERINSSTTDTNKLDVFVADIYGNVGVSNSANFDPKTNFNVFSTGNTVLRVASPNQNRPSLELLGNGNGRASGLKIMYNSDLDKSVIDSGYVYGNCFINNGSTNPISQLLLSNVVVDFDLIRPSGLNESIDVGFMGVSDIGYVGIGRTKEGATRIFEPNAPLTLHHTDRCGGLSGTMSIREQVATPRVSANYGKLYVKPFINPDHPITQSPFFLDDGGNEHRLILSKLIDTDGLVYLDDRGNTAAGSGCPISRPMSSQAYRNTLYGRNAGHSISSGDDNTLFGFGAGSGITSGSCNTVVGSKSLMFANGSKNVVIGCNNIGENATDDDVVNNVILIGNDLKTEEEISDGTILIGSGDIPIIEGRVGSNQYLDFNLDYININDGDLLFTEAGEFGDFTLRNSENKLCVLFSSGSIVNREIACFEENQLKATNIEVSKLCFSDGTCMFTAATSSGGGGGGDHDHDATVDGNCNHIFTNDSNTIDSANNSRSVFIGCDVGAGATGWKSSVLLGSEAGYGATVNNPSLSIDTACVFVGMRAGYEADNTENSLFLGTNAGKQASLASDSIFLGSNAGLYSQMKNSIGIGENALRGNTPLSFTNAGSGNIEIITGIEDSDRLMYQKEGHGRRLNIQNFIAGNSENKTLSVGDAILNPDAPLSVRRDFVHDNALISHTAYAAFVENLGGSGFLYPLYLFSTDAANDPNHTAGNDVFVFGGSDALAEFPTVTFYHPDIAGDQVGELNNLDEGYVFNTASVAGYEVFTSGLIPSKYVQTWYCDDVRVAALTCEGILVNDEDEPLNSGVSLQREGFYQEAIAAPTDYCSPTSGLFKEKKVNPDGSCSDGNEYYVTNRDVTLSIHNNAFGIVSKINSEWRPLWVSCDTSGPTTTTTVGPTTTTTVGPTTTTTVGPTTTTLHPPTTTTVGPTTTTTTNPFVASHLGGCESLASGHWTSYDHLASSVPIDDSYTYPSFESGAKSIFINTSWGGDSYQPTMKLYDFMVGEGNLARQRERSTFTISCDQVDEIPAASGWGDRFAALLTDDQQVPDFDTNTEPATLEGLNNYVTALNPATWPANRDTFKDSGSGVLILGYHDRLTGGLPELSGIVEASGKLFFDYMRCNGVVWVRGAGGGGADIANLNFVLENLLCESRFSVENSGATGFNDDPPHLYLFGDSKFQHENDLDTIRVYDPDGDLENFSLGTSAFIGGSKLCIPDASGFYSFNPVTNTVLNPRGDAINHSVNLHTQTNVHRDHILYGNIVNPIFMHSGDINMFNTTDVKGQFDAPAVPTMVHEFTARSGVRDIDPCNGYLSWRCCGGGKGGSFDPCDESDGGSACCDAAYRRFKYYNDNNLDLNSDNIPLPCVLTDALDASGWYYSNIGVCEGQTTCPPTTTTTVGPTTTTTGGPGACCKWNWDGTFNSCQDGVAPGDCPTYYNPFQGTCEDTPDGTAGLCAGSLGQIHFPDMTCAEVNCNLTTQTPFTTNPPTTSPPATTSGPTDPTTSGPTDPTTSPP